MEILETLAQSLEIENLISNSNNYLMIVSPYLKINNRLKPKLTEAFDRNHKNLIIYRSNELSKEEFKWLEAFNNVTLLPIKNLHAKCYMNETTALITSMNLYDYSQINNHELGIKFTNSEHPKEIKTLLNYINNIIQTDHSGFDFNYLLDTQTYTMSQLASELTTEYEFPKQPREINGAYLYICSIATKLHSFNEDDFYQDKSAILKTTTINYSTYNMLKREIIKYGIRRKNVNHYSRR